MNEQQSQEGLRYYLISKLRAFMEWMKPEPADPLAMQIVKSFFKGIVMLVLVALSPAIIVILAFVFLAAL